MNQKLIGLRILLEGSHFIQVAAYEGEGRQIIRNIVEGVYKLRDTKTITGTDPVSGVVWVVFTDAVLGAHTFSWDEFMAVQRQQAEAQQQRIPQAPLRPMWPLSGGGN